MGHIVNVQGNISSCVDLPTQLGFAKFLREDSDMKLRKNIRDTLKTKRDLMLQLFNTLEGLNKCKVTNVRGAFYLFPLVSCFFGMLTPDGKAIKDDEDLAVYLLDTAHVVTIPGSKFGRSGYLRIAYAFPATEQLQQGCMLLSKALQQLKSPSS
jgi:aspartate aminotransferase